MHTLKSTLAPLALSTVGWLLISTAAAASMRVEFSGTFSHCLVNFIEPGSCAGMTVSFSSVPAPAAVLGMLSALGALVLAGAGRRKRKMD